MIDLSPLDADAALRAGRITARVAGRVAQARRRVWDDVRSRLASWAIPAAIVAAASIALLFASREPAPRSPEPFAALVLDPGPVRGWVAFDRRPELAEVIAAAGRAP